jgi:hypothetical protein
LRPQKADADAFLFDPAQLALAPDVTIPRHSTRRNASGSSAGSGRTSLAPVLDMSMIVQWLTSVPAEFRMSAFQRIGRRSADRRSLVIAHHHRNARNAPRPEGP